MRREALFAVLLCAVGLVACDRNTGRGRSPSNCRNKTTSTSASEFPEVQTPLGRLRGSILQSLDGKSIFSFRGVRYAQPPVGELRFKSPVPVGPWDGVKNATKDGSRCPSTQNTNDTSEDCLFLNVYTTKLPHNTRNPQRPVVVFLHPSAYYVFSGTSDLYGPQYLMDEDIVLVTINYRLGALGFLSTGDSVLPGNNGLKDQVMALRWVQQNIASFGGNPGSVTIAGDSTGAVSAYLHMLSPMSRGLFHKIIAMSGADLTNGVRNPLQQAREQARLLNCPDTTSEEIINCLKGKDALEIAKTGEYFYDLTRNLTSSFAFVIEQDSGDGVEKFLPADVAEQFLQGNFAHVPVMTGTTKDELAYIPKEFLRSNVSQNLKENFVSIVLNYVLQEINAPGSNEIAAELTKFYLNDEPITNASGDALGKFYSDIIINYPVYSTVKIMSQLNTAPVYYYHFTYQGRYSWTYIPGTQTPDGVSHTDDLLYLFYTSTIFPEFVEADPEYTTVKRMTKMWANFVKTGNPTSEKTDLLNVDWQALKPRTPRYLEIGSQLAMRQGFYQKDRMQLLERLFPVTNISSWTTRRAG
ncbi:esterase E4-like [Schistocerca cancellata]|uniref:esterase E4-like n=1 Tax=Schistocerca cancellata TaxID=274614 RepID=UPI002117DFC3|nr:esterase E4-like [Schistocerca cancellata]